VWSSHRTFCAISHARHAELYSSRYLWDETAFKTIQYTGAAKFNAVEQAKSARIAQGRITKNFRCYIKKQGWEILWSSRCHDRGGAPCKYYKIFTPTILGTTMQKLPPLWLAHGSSTSRASTVREVVHDCSGKNGQ
jgi:hypothetical protein